MPAHSPVPETSRGLIFFLYAPFTLGIYMLFTCTVVPRSSSNTQVLAQVERATS